MNIQPVVVTLEPFSIIGVERYTENGVQSLLDAWSEFSRRYADIPNKADPPIVWAYEDYSRGFEPVPNGLPKYYFIVGVHVTSIESLPEGLIAKRAAGGEYARFDYEGVLDNLKDVFRYIYDEWLPKSSFVLDRGRPADLVRYPERAENDLGAVQIFIPIAVK